MEPSRIALISESWAAVLGVTPFIDGDPVSPSISASRRVQRIEDELRAIVKAFLRGRKMEAPEVGKLNFDKLSEALGQDLDPDRLSTAGDFPQEIALGLVQVVANARQYLLDKLPRSQKKTAFGLEAQRPGANKVREFQAVWSVVDDPLSALRDLTLGSLTTDMVEAIKRVYPSLYGRLVEIVIEEMAVQKGRNKDFDLSRTADKQLQVLLGTKGMNAQVGAAIQRLYAEAREKEENAPKGGGAIESGTEPTAGQKVGS